MSSGKVIIAGGGVGGLVAGIYAQREGFESIIYEKNPLPGGECTGWNRDGFHIDGCIHWLVGTKEGRNMNRIWKETGALEGVDVYQPESFTTVMHEEGNLVIWRDIKKLRESLLELSPGDRDAIEEFIESVYAFGSFEPLVDKPSEMLNFFEKIRFIYQNRKVFKKINKYSRLSIKDYKDRFKSPLIKTAFDQIVPEKYSAYSLFFTLAAFMEDNAGIPRGGSKAFSERLVKKYESLGGQIGYNSAVNEIIIDGNNATGIILEGGERVFGDYMVTACDPYVVFNKLLKGSFYDEQFTERYEDSETYPLQTSVYATFSVDTDLSSFPRNSVFNIKGLRFEDRTIDKLSMKHFCHEPSFSPEGKSVIAIYMDAGYEWWKDLYNDMKSYRDEKERLATDILRRLEERFPDLSGKLGVLDIATPVTYERYCGAYNGSWLSFGTTPQSEPLRHTGKIEGIKNLYMTGQWFMSPGGLPAAAITGKWTVARMCRDKSKSPQ